ncbi:MAG TPA: TMEM175 family protein [Ktedonobacterales bacterium]
MAMDDERRTSVTSLVAGVELTETTRLEAFSDGVFAVAITLLVLDIRVPVATTAHDGSLLGALASLWAHYLAYGISFLFILIMWVNHHRMFQLIHRSDHALLLLNGVLLLLVALVPFSTALLAEYINSPRLADQKVAALVYNGVYVVIAIVFNLLWRHAAQGQRLLAPDAHQGETDAITRGYVRGPVFYALAFVLALVNVPASVLLNVALAVYWALPPRRRVRLRPR